MQDCECLEGVSSYATQLCINFGIALIAERMWRRKQQQQFLLLVGIDLRQLANEPAKKQQHSPT